MRARSAAGGAVVIRTAALVVTSQRMATVAADLEVRDTDVVAGADLMWLGDTKDGHEVRRGQGLGIGSGYASRFEDAGSSRGGNLSSRYSQGWKNEEKQEDESFFHDCLLEET